MCATPLGDMGRVAISATLTLPRIESEHISEFATMHMRGVARSLRYASEIESREMRDSLVYSQLDERGITLRTNPVGSCSMDTDGDQFFIQASTNREATLYAHNLYHPIQQLICLAGAIVMAHSESYLLESRISVRIASSIN